MVEADDLGFFAVEFPEQTMDFLTVGKSLFGAVSMVLDVFDIAVFLIWHDSPLKEFFDDNAARDNGQVSGQAALAAKAAQSGVVVGEDCNEDFGGEILEVVLRDGDRAGGRGVVNDVYHQTEKPIDEIFPSVRLARQATLQKLAIDIRKRHAGYPWDGLAKLVWLRNLCGLAIAVRRRQS